MCSKYAKFTASIIKTNHIFGTLLAHFAPKLGHFLFFEVLLQKTKNRYKPLFIRLIAILIFGRDEWTRTTDPHLIRVVL